MTFDPAHAPQISAFDYALEKAGDHFLEVLYFDLGRYLIAAGAFTILLLVFNGWAKARRIQRNRAATRADYQREILSSLRTVLVFGVTTLTLLVGREFGFIKLSLDDAPVITLVWQFALIVVLHDAYFYWIHRWMHTRAMFRATHLHHHKSRTPTPWTAYSFSAWEAAFEAAFVPLFLLICSLMGFAFAGFAMFLFLWHMIIRNVMAHTGHELFPAGWVDTPLLRWITTTTHHDLHHSSGHNYGFYFTWWDKWMGTEHPRYHEQFRKNAKPLRLPTIARNASEKVSVILLSLFAAATTVHGWLIAVDPTLI